MKATLFFVAILFSAVAETYGDYRCPKFWTEFHGHCYRFFNQPRLNFAAAQTHCQNLRFETDDSCSCQSRRSDLVTIDSSEENAFILEWWKTVREPDTNTQNLHIGYHDRYHEGRWRWLSGSSSRYTNWDRGQPDNRYGGRQDCAVMWTYSGDNGKWDDQTCGNPRAFICEY